MLQRTISILITMKKIITLCVFAFALLIGSQNVYAQNTLEINAEANSKTKELRKVIKFDQEKMQAVYEALQEYGIAFKRISNNLSANDERLKKINGHLDNRLKDVFTDEEYQKYLENFRSE